MTHTQDEPIQDYAEDLPLSEESVLLQDDMDGHDADGSGVVYEHQSGRAKPTSRNGLTKAKLVAILAVTAVVAGGAYFMMRNKAKPAPMSPAMAAIAAEANAVPVSAHSAAQPKPTEVFSDVSAKPAVAETSPAVPSPEQHVASAAPAPSPALPPATASTAPLLSTATAKLAVASTASAVKAPAAISPMVPRADFDAVTKERDDANQQIADLKKQLKTAEDAAKPKSTVRVVHDRGHVTVSAVLKDGVVLRTENGKTLIAPIGAVVTVTSRSASLK